MNKVEFDQLMRNFYAKVTETGNVFTKDDYNSSFKDGHKKAQEVMSFLTDVKANLDRLAYISIGGADGSEVFHILDNTSIKRAIILEYDSVFCKSIREKGYKNLEVLEGDAWGHRYKCAEIVNEWYQEGLIDGVIISAFSVLHELPYRSDKNYNFLSFISTIVGSVGEAYFYCKEPTKIMEWAGNVKLNIPEWLTPSELYRFSKLVQTQFKDFFSNSFESQILQQIDGVVMDSQLAGEVVRKILYFLINKSVNRLIYELGECHAALDPIRLSNDVTKVFKKNLPLFESNTQKQMVSSETLNSLFRSNQIDLAFWDNQTDREGWLPNGFVRIWAYYRGKNSKKKSDETKGESIDFVCTSDKKQLFINIDKKLKDDEFFAKKLAHYEQRAVSGESLEKILIDLLDDIDYIKSNNLSEFYGLLQQYVGRLMIMSSVSNPNIHNGSILPFYSSREFIDKSFKLLSPKNQIESYWLSILTYREAKDLNAMKEHVELIISNSKSETSKGKYRLYAARELAILQYESGESIKEITKTLSIIEANLESIIISSEEYSYNNYEAVEKVITMWAYLDLCLKTMNIDKAKHFYYLITTKIDLLSLFRKLHVVMLSDFYRSLYLYHLLIGSDSESKKFYKLHEKLCNDHNLQNSMFWIKNINEKFNILMI